MNVNDLPLHLTMHGPPIPPKWAARQLARENIRGDFKAEAALHPYTDLNGTPLHWRIRTRLADGSKWIRPMKRQGMFYELGEPEFDSGKKPLYRLHEIANADPSVPVWFLEGEQKADALAKRGLLATTTGGATSEDRADWEPLRGRTIITWRDNDRPGHDHMQRVAKILLGLNCNVEAIDIEDLDLPEHGDVVDWFDANPHATAVDLACLARVPVFNGSGSTPATSSDEDWPDPGAFPSELAPVETLRPEMLPDGLRDWVYDAAERFQCPPDYLAVAAITAAGSLLGRRIAIRPQRKTDWTEYPNLWGLLIGRPGAMKSPAIVEATRFLRRFEFEAADRYTDELKRFSKQREIFEAKRAQAKKSKPSAIDQAFNDLGDEPAEPRQTRFLVNDASVEALHDLCRENPQGILTLRDEVSGLLRKLDQEQHASDRAFYLEAWNGNASFTYDRVGRGKSLAARINVSLLGGAQPSGVADYVRAAVRGYAGDDGLLQRFGLCVWPDLQCEWTNVDRYPHTEARQTAARVFELLRDLDTERLGAEVDAFDHRDAVPFLRFNEPAQILFDEWRAELEQALRTGQLLPALESHLTKYRKLVPALSLIFHLVDAGTGLVSRVALARALEWADYLRGHAERLYGAATSIEVRAARAILAKLRGGEVPFADPIRRTFAARDIYSRKWSGLDTDSTYDGLELLGSLNYLRVEEIETAGRPKTVYSANPKAFS